MKRDGVRRGFWYLIMVLLAAAFLVPILWTVLFALRPASERSTVPVKFLPSSLDFENFHRALTMIDFARYLKTSILLTTTYTVLVTLTSAIVGFAFARLRAPGRNQLFVVVLASLMIPAVILVIPTYVLFARVGLLGTYWPWVLWGLSGSPLMIFLFRQFFATVPIELEEAALLDGAGYVRMFVSIFLPLAKPMVATSIVLSFTYSWGDFLAPAIFLPPEKSTLAVAMSRGYVDLQGRQLPQVLAAGVCFYVLPVILVFTVAQRVFVRGLMSSGVKG